MPHLTRTLLTALLLFAVCAAPAQGEVSRKKSMWGPSELNGVSQFPIYEDLGVGIWQAALTWDQAAPTRPADPRNPDDPAYRWNPVLDRAVALAAKHNIEVSFLVIRTPKWANGGRGTNFAPSPRHFADFMEAVARRYPTVHHWMIWGEPTKINNFRPSAQDHGRFLRSAQQKRGVRLYARMLDAAYGRLKKVSRRNLVIGGNTWTTGGVRPRNWIRALRLPSGRPPRMDLYGHNPFSARRPDLSADPIRVGDADFSDLDTLVGWLDRYLKGAKPGGGKLQVFISEFSLPVDHANRQFSFFLTPEVQALWLGDSLRITRRWSRIYTLGYLGLYDEAPQPGGVESDWGLIDDAGVRRPAYEAYKQG